MVFVWNWHCCVSGCDKEPVHRVELLQSSPPTVDNTSPTTPNLQEGLQHAVWTVQQTIAIATTVPSVTARAWVSGDHGVGMGPNTRYTRLQLLALIILSAPSLFNNDDNDKNELLTALVPSFVAQATLYFHNKMVLWDWRQEQSKRQTK